MALFDNLKAMKESFTKVAVDVANNASTTAREQENINNIKKEIGVLNSEINVAYTQIGKKFMEYVLKNNEIPGIDISDILRVLEPKMERKIELEAQMVEIEKRLKDMAIIQEKNRLEEEFAKEKEKLDKALVMGIVDDIEYDQKINKYKKKIDNFEEIKKIEQQYEFGIIDLQEKEHKISMLLNS